VPKRLTSSSRAKLQRDVERAMPHRHSFSGRPLGKRGMRAKAANKWTLYRGMHHDSRRGISSLRFASGQLSKLKTTKLTGRKTSGRFDPVRYLR
jgi:hypothetical protein